MSPVICSVLAMSTDVTQQRQENCLYAPEHQELARDSETGSPNSYKSRGRVSPRQQLPLLLKTTAVKSWGTKILSAPALQRVRFDRYEWSI